MVPCPVRENARNARSPGMSRCRKREKPHVFCLPIEVIKGADRHIGTLVTALTSSCAMAGNWEPATCGLEIRWLSPILTVTGSDPDRRLQAQSSCPPRVASVIEGQHL